MQNHLYLTYGNSLTNHIFLRKKIFLKVSEMVLLCKLYSFTCMFHQIKVKKLNKKESKVINCDWVYHNTCSLSYNVQVVSGPFITDN